MKIVTQGGQSATPPPSQASQDARARAIAVLTGTQPQVNSNSVSPEEMGAVKAPQTLQDAPGSTQTEGLEATSEAATEAPKTPPQDPLSKQYAILARKEKQLRAEKAQLQADRLAIEKQRAELSKPAFDESKWIARDKLMEDPLTSLSEMGLSYEELTNRALNAGKSDPATLSLINKMQAKIDALESKQDQATKSYQDQQQQQYKQAVEQIRSETKQLVTTSPDFETIRETESVDDVVELIERTFKAEGRLLSVEDAARAVEDYLTEEAIKIARLKKIQQKLNSVAQSPTQPQATQQKQPLKTLTNSVGTTRPLSAKERAVLAFKGELKS